MAGSSSKTCYFTIQNQSSGYFPRPLRITEVWAFVWVVKVHLWLLIRRPHGRVDVANWMGFLGVKGWPEKLITRWKDDWNDAYHSNFIICHWNFGRVVFSLYGLIRFRAPTWFLLLLCWSTTYGSYSSWYLIVSWSFIWFSLQNQSKPCSSNQSNVMRKSTDCRRICLIVA